MGSGPSGPFPKLPITSVTLSTFQHSHPQDAAPVSLEPKWLEPKWLRVCVCVCACVCVYMCVSFVFCQTWETRANQRRNAGSSKHSSDASMRTSWRKNACGNRHSIRPLPTARHPRWLWCYQPGQVALLPKAKRLLDH